MKIEIPDNYHDGSVQWFASLPPGIRAALMQAWWECEGEPKPLPRKACDYRRADCTNEGQTVHGRWVCSNHYPARD